ncbi:UNVERIFIED_ORG: hypothetical protein GGD51_005038 [Rhizobium esperanzae]
MTIEPGAPALQDVRSVLLQCVCGLFLKVHPRPRSQAPSALRLIFTCRSTDKRSTISSSVTSLRSSINATTNSSCASTAEGRLQPCGRAVNSPSFALAIQRIAVEIPTPKRAATCRADMPDADAFKLVFGDHRSEPVPSSTSSLWMLNQLRWTPSHHNRFIDRRTCSRSGARGGRNSVAENDDALRTAPNEILPAASSL